jgi:uncharacterized damage-inducible protein DinB
MPATHVTSAAQALLQELEQEAATTRRLLERVPQDMLAWKPHAKSMSLGQLALHIATMPGNIAGMSQRSPFPLPEFVQPAADDASALPALLDDSVAAARGILGSMDEAALGRAWSVVRDGQEIMTLPVGAMLRMLMLNHWYHHRGQLSVYLRELDVPLPSIYGPTADENPFAGGSRP